MRPLQQLAAKLSLRIPKSLDPTQKPFMFKLPPTNLLSALNKDKMPFLTQKSQNPNGTLMWSRALRRYIILLYAYTRRMGKNRIFGAIVLGQV